MTRLFCALGLLISLAGCQPTPPSDRQDFASGTLLYENPLASAQDVKDWVMEGPGEVTFNNGWMQMFSPTEAMHHVFWCPQVFPDSFVAEWEAQPRKTDAGLVIVFFAAKGAHGESIFDPALPPRDGTFSQYTEGAIKSYHISYYANAAHNPDRGHANLRKNNTFTLLQEGEVGIPTYSARVHKIRLIKQHNHIVLFVDDRKVIDYTDDKPVVNGVDTGTPLTDGRLGFRQMKWTRFQYRNLKVWGLE